MSWWRLHPRRSARWQAKRRLNARRTVRGRPWVSRQVRSAALRSDWKVAAIAALVSSLPLAWFAGRHSEHWLDGAWVVSAILIGLAIGLIVVLLQLASGPHVRSEPTFRAVISSSGVMWPVAFSLVFVAWVGVIELTSGRRGPPSAIADYTLAYFIVGVFLQAVVFVRTVRLIAPAGIARVMRAVQADGTRRSVRERLTREYANEIFLAAAERAGLATALGARGATVTIDEGGLIDDLDVRLPARIAALDLQGSTAITARVGLAVERDSTGIASAAGAVPPWRSAMLRRAVHVRRRPRRVRDSLSIFREAVDLARQSMGEGARPEVAIDHIMVGLEELQRAYALYGLPYESSSVREPWTVGDEDQVLTELIRFSRDAFALSRDSAGMETTRLGHRMVLLGVDEDAPFLIDQGLELWLSQVSAARSIISRPEARDRLIDSVSDSAQSVIFQLAHSVENSTLPLSERLAAGTHLTQLFRFMTRLLKSHIDAVDVPAFIGAWERTSAWARDWSPGEDVAAAELELTLTTKASEQRQLSLALAEARRVVQLRDDLVEAREWGRFNLGAWLCSRYRQKQVDRETWERLYPYLVGAFGTAEALSPALAQATLLDGPTQQLDEWDQPASGDVSKPTAFVGTHAVAVALFWATLLLLRGTTPNARPELSFSEPVAYVGKWLLATLDAIRSAPETWEPLVGEQLQRRASRLEESITDAIAEEQRAMQEGVASSPLSQTKIAQYADTQLEAFVRDNRLRELLMTENALISRITNHAFREGLYGEPLDRRLFLDAASYAVAGPEPLGRLAALNEQAIVFEALNRIAVPAPHGPDPVASAIAAIGALRADGLKPGVVLVPSGMGMRAALSSHGAFRRAIRSEATSKVLVGFLDDVPVLAVTPQADRTMVVADLGRSVRLTEKRRPDMNSPLRVKVAAIDEARANQLLDHGAGAPGETRAARLAGLTYAMVEVFVDLDVTVETLNGGAPTAYRIQVPADEGTSAGAAALQTAIA
jgi:hypothetical protein